MISSKELIEKYPNLFTDNGKPTLRFNYLECDEGWSNILDIMCNLIQIRCEDSVLYKKTMLYGLWLKIYHGLNKFLYGFTVYNKEALTDRNMPMYSNPNWTTFLSKKVNKIHFKIYNHYMEKSKKNKVVYPKFIVIKEKFGALRISYSIFNNDKELHSAIDSIIAYAEKMSEVTCEKTGNFGVLCEKHGWYKTLSELEQGEYKPLLRKEI